MGRRPVEKLYNSINFRQDEDGHGTLVEKKSTLSPLADYTWTMWYNPFERADVQGLDAGIVAQQNGSNSVLAVRNHATNYFCTIMDGSIDPFSFGPELDQWQLTIFRHDVSEKDAILDVCRQDGTIVGHDTVTYAGTATESASDIGWTLGANGGTNKQCQGRLTGVRSWDRKLTDAEVTNIIEKAIYPTDFLGEYLMKEGQGASMANTGSLGGSATLTNSPPWSGMIPMRRYHLRPIPQSIENIDASDYGSMTDADSLVLDGDFTIGIRAKSHNIAAGVAFPSILGKGDAGASRELALFVTQSTNQLAFAVYDSGGTRQVSNVLTDWTDNDWNHIIFKRATNDFTAIVGNKEGLQTSTENVSVTIVDSDGDWVFGAARTDTVATTYWDGPWTDPFILKGQAATDDECFDWIFDGKMPAAGSGSYSLTTDMDQGEGTITDTSGSGNTITLSGDARWILDSPKPLRRVPTGAITSVSLDGSNDDINFGNILNFTETDSFTMGGWYFIREFENNMTLWDKFSAGGYRMVISAAGVCNTQFRQADSTLRTGPGVQLPLNKWFFIAADYDGPDDSSRIGLYGNVDGESSSLGLADLGVVSTDLQIGHTANNAVFANMFVGPVGIYSSTLTSAQWRSWASGNPPAGATIMIDMKETNVSQATDVSGNANHGTINGGTRVELTPDS